MIGIKKVAVGMVVTAAAATGAVMAHATGPAKNGAIAFKLALGAPSRLAVVNADGTKMLKLPRTKQVNDDDPDWSPNGSTIAFTRCPLGNGRCHIDTMSPSGSGLKQLGPANDDRAYPAWSPDGKQIAYSRAWGGVQNDEIKYSALYVMSPSGGGAHLVVNPMNAKPFEGDVNHSSWSPDGKQLVVEVTHSPLGDPANGHALFVVNADGSNLQQLTPWTLNAGGKPDWSPDGSRILFRAPSKTERSNLYTIAPDGTGLKQLTHYSAPIPVVSPGSFSPDGKWITFAKSGAVWVMRADGAGARQVTPSEYAYSPDWGPAK
jgi:TolB protein